MHFDDAWAPNDWLGCPACLEALYLGRVDDVMVALACSNVDCAELSRANQGEHMPVAALPELGEFRGF